MRRALRCGNKFDGGNEMRAETIAQSGNEGRDAGTLRLQRAYGRGNLLAPAVMPCIGAQLGHPEAPHGVNVLQ